MKRKTIYKEGIILGLILLLSLGSFLLLQMPKETKLSFAQEEEEVYFQRGKEHYLKGEYLQAKESLEKVLESLPHHKLAQKYLKLCKKKLIEIGRKEGSERTGREAEEKKVKRQQERLAKERQLQEERQRQRAEREAKLERIRLAKEARKRQLQEEKQRQEAERKAKLERIRLAKEARKRQLQEERQRQEAERKAKLERIRLAKEAKLRQLQEERQRQEAEREAKEERERLAKEVKERQLQEERQRQETERRERKEKEKLEETIKNYYEYGKSYFKEARYTEALSYFNKIKELDPKHPFIPRITQYITTSQERLKGKERKEFIISKQQEEVEQMKEEISCLKKKQKRDEIWLSLESEKRVTLPPTIEEKRILEKEVELKSEEFKEPLEEVREELIREKLQVPVTANFRDVKLSYVIDYFSEVSGINIILSSEAYGEDKKVSISVKDLPLETALKYLLKSQGLIYRIEEEVIWVASPEEMDKEPLETRIYSLQIGATSQAMFAAGERTTSTISGLNTIKELIKEAVSWPGESKLVLDERTGILIVTNTPSNLRKIEKIIKEIDILPYQILIEARFLRTEVMDLKELGLEWILKSDFAADKQEGNLRHGLKPGAKMNWSAFERAAEGLNLTYQGKLTYPEFEVVLHALRESKKTKVLSAPRITTLNNQSAKIQIIDEWIYPTRFEPQPFLIDLNKDNDFADPNETTTVLMPTEFITRDVGIILQVTPSIGKDKKSIILSLVPEVSEGIKNYFEYAERATGEGGVTEGAIKLPKFTVSTLTTTVVINNQDTVVLGGLIKETKHKTRVKVPLLGDLPLLGGLFRKNYDNLERSNLLIFVTATILSPEGEEMSVD